MREAERESREPPPPPRSVSLSSRHRHVFFRARAGSAWEIWKAADLLLKARVLEVSGPSGMKLSPPSLSLQARVLERARLRPWAIAIQCAMRACLARRACAPLRAARDELRRASATTIQARGRVPYAKRRSRERAEEIRRALEDRSAARLQAGARGRMYGRCAARRTGLSLIHI